MGKLKDTMLMKTDSHFINKPGWGISFMIDGHKFYAREGSDLCDLTRSIIMDSIDAIKKTIDLRQYLEGFVYSKANELTHKRQYGSVIFEQKDLFESIKTEAKGGQVMTKKMAGSIVQEPKKSKPVKVNNNDMLVDLEAELKEISSGYVKKDIQPVISEIKQVVKSDIEFDDGYEDKSNFIERMVNIKKSAPSKKSDVEVIREVVKSPTVIESLKKEKQAVDILSNLKIEKEEPKEKKAFFKPSKAENMDVKGTVFNNEQIETFKNYAKKCSELKKDTLTRNETRNYQIKTESRLFNKSHPVFLKMYEEWKLQEAKKLEEAKKAVVKKVVAKKPASKKVVAKRSVPTLEDVFKSYDSLVMKLKVEKVSRDIVRQYHINYERFSNRSYTQFMEMYKNWKMKK